MQSKIKIFHIIKYVFYSKSKSFKYMRKYLIFKNHKLFKYNFIFHVCHRIFNNMMKFSISAPPSSLSYNIDFKCQYIYFLLYCT